MISCSGNKFVICTKCCPMQPNQGFLCNSAHSNIVINYSKCFYLLNIQTENSFCESFLQNSFPCNEGFWPFAYRYEKNTFPIRLFVIKYRGVAHISITGIYIKQAREISNFVRCCLYISEKYSTVAVH